MQPALAFLPIVVPVLFWATYHYHKDRHLPEPAHLLLLAFALGIMSAGLAKMIYLGLGPLGLRFDALELAQNNPVGLLIFTVFGIGPIEELAKLIPFLVVIIHLEAFDEPLDGIIYASFIGLGYAAVENVLYLQYLTPLESIARGFAAPVVHILFASIWAHWITCARLKSEPILRPALIGFALSAGLHGVYDFLVLLHPVSALPIAAALIFAIWTWRLQLMRELHEHAVKNSNT